MKKINWRLGLTLILASLNFGLGQTQISSSEALSNAFLTGGEFQLEAGRYELTSALTLSRDLSLKGQSQETTTIILKASPVALSVEEAIHINIQNISFEYAGEEAADLFNIGSGTFLFTNCSFKGAKFIEPEADDGIWYGDAIYLYGDAQGSINNATFSENGLAGIQTDENSQLTLTGSSFSQNNASIGLFGNSNLVASKNTFQNNQSDDAVIAVYGESQLKLTENQFLNNETNALYAYDSSRVDVENNLFENNGTTEVDTIFLEDTAVGSFTDNTFQNNPRIALTLSGDSSAVIAKNLFEANGNEEGFAAFTVEGTASATLTDNTFHQNKGGAINLLGNAQASMENNTLSANKTWVSVYLEGNTKLTSTGNLFETSEGDAVYLTGQAELNSEGDSFLNNTEFAIDLAGQAQATVSNSIFEGNRSGIFLEENSYASISSSIFKNNQRSGIGFLGASKGFAKNNIIEGHSRNGIAAAGTSSPSIEENQLSHNGHGILLAETTTATLKGNTLKQNVHGIYIVTGSSPEILENIFESNDNDQTEGLEPNYE